MAAGTSGWSSLPGLTAAADGSAVAATPPARPRRRYSPRCAPAARRRRQTGADGGGLAGHWLASRTSPAASTVRGYTTHVRLYLAPYPGQVLLAELSAGHVQAMFTAIIRQHQALGSTVSAATLNRIRATLRAALNAAMRRGLITDNPASQAELPRARRPRAVVWTSERVERCSAPASTPQWRCGLWRRPPSSCPALDHRSPAVCRLPSDRAARTSAPVSVLAPTHKPVRLTMRSSPLVALREVPSRVLPPRGARSKCPRYRRASLARQPSRGPPRGLDTFAAMHDRDFRP